mmetsp:Transcript_6093/g.15449  ORF Transcript_6093/g.15449 Transcript_6093/m.15449 type:complete len:251 (-) Transcript_6093:627-1379(-)
MVGLVGDQRAAEAGAHGQHAQPPDGRAAREELRVEELLVDQAQHQQHDHQAAEHKGEEARHHAHQRRAKVVHVACGRLARQVQTTGELVVHFVELAEAPACKRAPGARAQPARRRAHLLAVLEQVEDAQVGEHERREEQCDCAHHSHATTQLSRNRTQHQRLVAAAQHRRRDAVRTVKHKAEHAPLEEPLEGLGEETGMQPRQTCHHGHHVVLAARQTHAQVECVPVRLGQTEAIHAQNQRSHLWPAEFC